MNGKLKKTRYPKIIKKITYCQQCQSMTDHTITIYSPDGDKESRCSRCNPKDLCKWTWDYDIIYRDKYITQCDNIIDIEKGKNLVKCPFCGKKIKKPKTERSNQ